MTDPKAAADAEWNKRRTRKAKPSPPPPAPKAAAKPDFVLVNFDDIVAQLNWIWIVYGWLLAQQIAVIFGRYGSGKTFLALDIALHVAAERGWLGHDTKGGRVVYVAAEAGKSIGQRIAAWKAEHPALTGLPFSVLQRSIDLCHAANGDLDRLLAAIRATANGHPLALVVVDTISRVMAGGNENSPEDMGGVRHSLDRIRDELECAVVAVHHMGKDEGRGPRGHSLLPADVDTLIEVERDDETGISTATVTKQRDGSTGARESFKLREVTLGLSADGKPVTSCVVDALVKDEAVFAPPKTAKKKKLGAIDRRALALLKKAILEAGKPVTPSNHAPQNALAVDYATWRRYFMSGTISDSAKEASRRTQLKRSSVVLQNEGYVGIWGEEVWIV